MPIAWRTARAQGAMSELISHITLRSLAMSWLRDVATGRSVTTVTMTTTATAAATRRLRRRYQGTGAEAGADRGGWGAHGVTSIAA